jgi:DNA-binding HxlR family transcriptional regulator
MDVTLRSGLGHNTLLLVRFSDLLAARYASTVSPQTEPTPRTHPRLCSIADALDVVGDRWSLLILRELGLGVHRFNDIRANTGAPRETLTTRLRELEDSGVITRRRYSEHPPRDEYLLTDAGESISPVLSALRAWGERYATHQPTPAPTPAPTP